MVLAASALAEPVCPVDTVVVKGRIDHPPSNPDVRVVLIYAKLKPGESSDIIPETEHFRVPVDFLTVSPERFFDVPSGRCARRPTAVIVTLLDRKRNRAYDQISLDFAKDFKMIDSTTYVLKSDLLLRGTQ